MDSEDLCAQSKHHEPYRAGFDSYNYGCMDSIDDFFSYAENYKQAGDALIEWVERQHGLADSVVHPLCFLYRQYLELILKNIILESQVLLRKSEKIRFNHKIKNLWDICKKLLTEVYGEDFLLGNAEVEKRIERFLSIAPSHDAFRYPVLRDKKKSFPNHHYVNVRILGEEMNEIWEFFFGVSNDIAERLKDNH